MADTRKNKSQRIYSIFLLMLAVYLDKKSHSKLTLIQWIRDIDMDTILWFVAGFTTGFLIVYLSSRLEGKSKDRYDIF